MGGGGRGGEASMVYRPPCNSALNVRAWNARVCLVMFRAGFGI